MGGTPPPGPPELPLGGTLAPGIGGTLPPGPPELALGGTLPPGFGPPPGFAGVSTVGCVLNSGWPLNSFTSDRNFFIGTGSANTSVWPSSMTSCRSSCDRLALMSRLLRASRSRRTE